MMMMTDRMEDIARRAVEKDIFWTWMRAKYKKGK